jgi:hypothetical protein
MKNALFLTLLFLSVKAIAQIPTNGLIRYYPFTGNANDISSNFQNGTVNGATLTTDRFGNPNSAYDFDGINDYIEIPLNGLLLNEFTYSAWALTSTIPTLQSGRLVVSVGTNYSNNPEGGDQVLACNNLSNVTYNGWGANGYNSNGPTQYIAYQGTDVVANQWTHLVVTRSSNAMKLYVNCILVQTDSTTFATTPTYGNDPAARIGSRQNNTMYFDGKIDDVRIYNRALSNSEISMLCNECLNYQTITVTDTLIINSSLVGFNPVTYQNTIKVFPNPTNENLTVDFGTNFSTLNGYTFEITNSLGQSMYNTPINQQQTTIDIATWANGVYFVNIIDTQGNTIDTRQIVKQ